MSLPYNRNLIPRARELRKEMTPQEKKLWYEFLSLFKYRFQRQKTVGGYITDFFCAKAKLVVEVDGNHHYKQENIEYDNIRTSELENLGIKVLRVTNANVDQNFREVCKEIEKQTLSRINRPA